jgi:anti-sigma28 factor (negative regulator of flagellin synthesis)
VKLGIFSRYEDERCNSNEVDSSEPECALDTRPTNTAPSDKPPLSNHQQPAQKDNAVLEETPESRAKRVEELRQQVRGGSYEIPVPQLLRILAAFILRRR